MKTLAALLWLLLIIVAVRAESEGRRSVAEDLVRELRELERAVDRGRDPQDSSQRLTTPANDPSGPAGQGESPLGSTDGGESPREAGVTTLDSPPLSLSANAAADSQTPTESLGGENSTEAVDQAVDTAENALEKAADRAEEVLEKNTEQAEERLEEETERAEEEIEEAVEEAEEEMEEARGKTRGKGARGRGRGLGRSGKNKNKNREDMRRDREERRGNRRQGAKRPSRMTPEERQQRRAAKKQTRSLQRLVRFLEKRLALLEKAIPEENRDDAMFDVVRGLLDRARKLLMERKEKESTATAGNEASPSEGETNMDTTEGQVPGNAEESPTELTPSSTRELKELLRLLVNKNL